MKFLHKNINLWQNKILSISNGIVYVVFAVVCFYLFLLSLFTTCFMVYTDEHVYYLKDFAIIMSVGLICLCFVLTFVKTKWSWEIKKLKRLAVIVTLLWAILMAAFILYMRLVPIYDQSSVYYAAFSLLTGDFTPWKAGEYFDMLAYQNGMVLLMVPFAFVFGNNAYIAFQLFNILFMILSYVGIAKVASVYFGKKSGYVTYLALFAVIPAWTQVTYIYGSWPQICLSIWAIWFEICFEQTKKWRNIIACGICIMFSILCKSNAEIILLAICIMLLLHAIREKSWKMIVGIVIVVFCGILEQKSVPIIMHMITGQDTSEKIPFTAWLAMGLQESSIAPGWYNEFPTSLYKQLGNDKVAITQAVWQSFHDSFVLFGQQKVYAVRFFARKLASMWADPAFQFFTGVNTRNLHGTFPYWIKDIFYNGGIANTILYLGMDVLQSIQYFGLILFLILGRKKLKLAHSHLIVCILGGFLFHLIGEAKSYYVIPYYLMMVPFSVQGYRYSIEKIVSIKEEKQSIRKLCVQKVKTGSGKLFIVLAMLIVLFTFMGGPIMTATIKLGGEESDYVWYCTHETEWKEAGYYKQ